MSLQQAYASEHRSTLRAIWSKLYKGTSLTIKRTPLGPYRRPVPRVLGGFLGGWAVSYERGTPVLITLNVSQIQQLNEQIDRLSGRRV